MSGAIVSPVVAFHVDVAGVASETHDNRASVGPRVRVDAVLLGQAQGHRPDEGRAAAILEGA
jgi:hypothetical protein